MKNLKIILLAVLIFGCKTTQRVISSSKIDSVSVHKMDSVKTAAKDSSGTTKKDSTVTSSRQNEDNVSVVFSPADTAKHNTPVVIVQHKDSIVIDAGGRKIDNINITKKQKQKDSVGVTAQSATQVKTADSAGLKKADSTNLTRDDKTKQVDKRKPAMIYFEVLLAAAVAIGLAYLFGNYKISLSLSFPYISFTKKLK